LPHILLALSSVLQRGAGDCMMREVRFDHRRHAFFFFTGLAMDLDRSSLGILNHLNVYSTIKN
jgi:hypothetical protein